MHVHWCSGGNTTGSSVRIYLENIDREWKVYGAKCMYVHMIPIMATGN